MRNPWLWLLLEAPGDPPPAISASPLFLQQHKTIAGNWISLRKNYCISMYLQAGRLVSGHLWPPPSPSRPSSSAPTRLRCSSSSKKDPSFPDDDDDEDISEGDQKIPRDWDKAWSAYRKQQEKKKKRKIFSNFNLDKYVSWNPKRSEYPLSEEIDPIKRAERTNLMFWTSPSFTLYGAIVIVSLLLVYTLLAPTPK